MWEDLRRHPDLVVAEKEAGLLHRHPDDDDQLRRIIERRRSGLRPGQAFGEVCTTYAMRPHLPDVSDRAARLLGQQAVAIYLVRHPLHRIISHHRHDVASGRMRMGIDEAVRADPRLLDYTRYATQVRPWIAALGADRVQVIALETYVRDRSASLAAVCHSIGVSRPTAMDDVVHNASLDKPVATGAWRRLSASGAYRRVLRPLLPEGLRRRAMSAVLPVAPPAPPGPSADTIALIRRELASEVDDLRGLAGPLPWPDEW